MNITDNPTLKPVRDYSEHDVINLYAHESGSVNRGTFVALQTANGNTNVYQNTGASVTPHVGFNNDLSSNTPSRATVLRPEVAFKIKTATSGDVVLGVMLADVRETNRWGEKYIHQPRHERSEQQVVVSGEAVPVLTDGWIKTNGIVGTPGPGSGAIISSGANAGKLLVTPYSNSIDNVGKFLSSKDADGFAFFKVEL